MRVTRVVGACVVAMLLLIGAGSSAQTLGEPEEFTAVAVQNNNAGSGAGRVYLTITRWTTEAEQARLVRTLLDVGPDAFLEALKDAPPVGTIRTPDSLAYDLRYAAQTPLEDGGRRIVLATDRPIGFWELANQPRTIRYPVTIVRMQMGPDGKGEGTLSIATKILAHDNIIELENFTTAPVMLTEIRAHKTDD